MPAVRRPVSSGHALAASLALSVWMLAASPTMAAPDTRFAPTAEVQGTVLQLNGSGTRFKGGFAKIYDLGLYTQRKVTSGPELIALPGPKRLQFTALRELPGTELGRLFLKNMSENATKTQMNKHAVSTMRLIEVFSGRSKLVKGDTFAMDFVPGKGTTFYIAGQPQGAPVGDAEFFAMVLGIWVGDSPADPLLRDALLGE